MTKEEKYYQIRRCYGDKEEVFFCKYKTQEQAQRDVDRMKQYPSNTDSTYFIELVTKKYKIKKEKDPVKNFFMSSMITVILIFITGIILYSIGEIIQSPILILISMLSTICILIVYSIAALIELINIINDL